MKNMETLNTGFEKRDSIALKRNAKGEYAWDVKTYYNPVEEEMTEIVEHIEIVDGMLKEKFL